MTIANRQFTCAPARKREFDCRVIVDNWFEIKIANLPLIWNCERLTTWKKSTILILYPPAAASRRALQIENLVYLRTEQIGESSLLMFNCMSHHCCRDLFWWGKDRFSMKDDGWKEICCDPTWRRDNVLDDWDNIWARDDCSKAGLPTSLSLNGHHISTSTQQIFSLNYTCKRQSWDRCVSIF